VTLQTLSQWLRCPSCLADLEPRGPLVLGCDNGHRFDANKRGYVTLREPGDTVTGDTPDMLDRRARLLDGGAYSPIAAGLSALSRPGARVIDAGCGTGYYLRAVLGDDESARALALDTAPAAVVRATRDDARIDGIVANTWRLLPIRDRAADVVINVFAPRNLPEFRRVLADDGTLLVVVPVADHLIELRERADMLDVPEGKTAELLEAAAGLFSHAGTREVRYELVLTPETAALIAGMGPSAFHGSRGAALGPAPTTATVAVDIVALRRL
jgi:23S rRNA (guanine745-N1)-methyltransferase